MEDEEDGERDEGVKRPRGSEQRWPVVAEDERVVGDADDAEDEEDHDGAQPPQRRAELEHVPRHRRPRSVHLRLCASHGAAARGHSAHLPLPPRPPGVEEEKKRGRPRPESSRVTLFAGFYLPRQRIRLVSSSRLGSCGIWGTGQETGCELEIEGGQREPSGSRSRRPLARAHETRES